MKKTIHIFSNGELKRKDNTLYFESEEGKKYIPVENTSEIMIHGDVTLNKKFLEFVSKSEIILHFFNHYGYYVGTFYPREHLNSGYIILKQAEHYLDNDKRTNLAKLFVIGSINNILKILAYYNNREKELNCIIEKIETFKNSIPKQQDIDQLMAIEGNVREEYYNAFDIILNNEHFVFESRTKQPPKNRLNCLISFGNSLLYTVVLSEIYQTYLDPRIGYLHSTNFRRFTLNLDVAEIFKPIIVDRTIFTLINKNIIKCSHFEKKLDGIVLNEQGKSLFIKEFEEKLKSTFYHKNLNTHVSYRRLIRLELYKIIKHIMGEEEFKPFIIGW